MSDAVPEIRFIANLWTLVEHPSAGDEWSLAEKVGAVKEAGFDGVNHRGSAELHILLEQHGLEFSGLFDANDPSEYADLIRTQLECGSSTINVQLCDHDTPVEEAI